MKADIRISGIVMYYSEDVLYEPPWKVEHSYFCLDTDGDSKMEVFSDKL